MKKKILITAAAVGLTAIGYYFWWYSQVLMDLQYMFY